MCEYFIYYVGTLKTKLNSNYQETSLISGKYFTRNELIKYKYSVKGLYK